MSLDRDLAATAAGKAGVPDLATVPARPKIEPREAREAAGQPAAGGSPDAADDHGPEAGADGAASVVDQLAKLAGLLESGLLTREEFDRLKGGLLEGP